MKGKLRWIISLSILFLPSLLLAEEKILRLFLNTEDRGDYFLLTEEEDVLISEDKFLSLGFKEGITYDKRKDGRVSLKSLSFHIKYRVCETEAALYITADPRLLKRHTLDLSPEKISLLAIFPLKEDSLYLNYRLNSSYKDGDFYGFSGLGDLSLRIGEYLFLSGISYNDGMIRRLNTNIVRDIERKMLRITLGDIHLSSGELGGGGSILGLNVKKEFSLKEGFVRYPLPSFSCFLDRPSEVEVYLGNRLIKKGDFSSGELELINLPLMGPQEELRLVIKDKEGGIKEVSSTLYYSPQLLKEGLWDYTYSLGLKRQKDSYKGLVGKASCKVGLRRNITAGMEIETEKGLINIGPSFIFLLPYGFGVFKGGMMLSNSKGVSGGANLFDYSLSKGRASLAMGLRGFSPKYSNLSLRPDDDKIRLRKELRTGLSLGRFGFLSGVFSWSDRYRAGRTKTFSLNYSKKISFVFLNLMASRREDKKVVDEVRLMAHIPLGRDSSAGYKMEKIEEGKTKEEVSFSISPNLGFGLRAEAKNDPNIKEQYDERISLRYRSTYGEHSLRYQGRNKGYSLSAKGAISFIGGPRPYLSRTIYDGFALVKVGKLSGAKIYRGGLLVGRTNKRGECLIPQLTSYHPTRVSVDTKGKELPFEYSIKEPTRYISTPYKGGVRVKFEAGRTQVIVGRLLLPPEEGGGPIELETLTIFIPEEISLPVGRDGEFYGENIPQGRYKGKVWHKGKEYECQIEIPESEEMLIDVGDIICYP